MPDLQIRLIDIPALIALAKMPVDNLIEGMENQRLRDSRPKLQEGMERGFSIDLEGDFLQWMDEWRSELGDGPLLEEIREAFNRKMIGIVELSLIHI